MILTIFIVFISFVGLIIVHEFGHFILAKKFGIKVEEFGIGFPPRLFGKKIGETIYSLNLLPLGGFVKIYGEEGGIEDSRSFSGKPVWQRCLIILGGVVAFWIIAVVLLSIVAGAWGIPVGISDEMGLNNNLINPKVQIDKVYSNTPAEQADLKSRDIIVGFYKIKDFQEFIGEHQNKEISFSVVRGNEVLEKKVKIEEALGVGLYRTATKTYPWYLAPWGGIETTGYYTTKIVYGWVIMGGWTLGLISELPEGIEEEDISVMGPLGISLLLGEFFKMGTDAFLSLVALIAIALAMINILPIPALDGGRMAFLTIEAVRGKPINYKIEQKINTVFFILLISLMIFITVRFDIPSILNN
jgi:regulator of sigma E protease